MCKALVPSLAQVEEAAAAQRSPQTHNLRPSFQMGFCPPAKWMGDAWAPRLIATRQVFSPWNGQLYMCISLFAPLHPAPPAVTQEMNLPERHQKAPCPSGFQVAEDSGEFWWKM